MTARKAVVATGISLCAALSLAPPAPAAGLDPIFEFDNWRVDYKERADLKFCGMAKGFKAPIHWLHYDFIQQSGSGGRTRLSETLTVYAAHAPALKRGETVTVIVRLFLRSKVKEFSARGKTKKTSVTNGVAVIANEKIARLFKTARAVSVAYRGYESPRLSLFGSARALEETERCVEERF